MGERANEAAKDATIVDEDGTMEFWDRLKAWTRQEHDGQWLSLGVFVVVALLGAVIITQAQVIPGYKINPLLEDSNIIDIAWNEAGTSALAIISSQNEYSVIRVDGNEQTMVFNGSANAVERTTVGWIVVGDDGYVATCSDPCNQIANKSFIDDWNGSATGQDVIGVASADGRSGLLLISDVNNLATIRYFSEDVLSAPAAPMDEGISLSSITTLSDGESLAVGKMIADLPSWSEGDKNPASSSHHSRGVIVAVDYNTYYVDEAPELTVIHVGEYGVYHSILPDSRDNGMAVVAGTSGAIHVGPDLSINTVEGAPGSTSAAVDNNGDIWFAGNLELQRIGLLESGKSVAETVEVPQGADFKSTLAVSAGDEVHFYGKFEGERVTLDPNIRNSMQSLSVLGDLLFVIISLVILSMMAWNLYDNWHLGGW